MSSILYIPQSTFSLAPCKPTVLFLTLFSHPVSPSLPNTFQNPAIFIPILLFLPPIYIQAQPQGSDFLTPYLKKFCASEPAGIERCAASTFARAGAFSILARAVWRVVGAGAFSLIFAIGLLVCWPGLWSLAVGHDLRLWQLAWRSGCGRCPGL